jgi:hypothetical protein
MPKGNGINCFSIKYHIYINVFCKNFVCNFCLNNYKAEIVCPNNYIE